MGQNWYDPIFILNRTEPNVCLFFFFFFFFFFFSSFLYTKIFLHSFVEFLSYYWENFRKLKKVNLVNPASTLPTLLVSAYFAATFTVKKKKEEENS